MFDLERYNTERGNLSLERTNVLLEIQSKLEEQEHDLALEILEDFINEHGYNENPLIECPNHGGGWDCPVFCRLCEGDQVFCPMEVADAK